MDAKHTLEARLHCIVGVWRMDVKYYYCICCTCCICDVVSMRCCVYIACVHVDYAMLYIGWNR